MEQEQFKKKLQQFIEYIDDKELLNAVKEGIIAYQKAEISFDDLSVLSEADRTELEESISENREKYNLREEEFHIHICERRKKLSITSDW